MKAYIGLGSNVDNRLRNLKQAVREINQAGLSILKTSSVYETPALLPDDAPDSWDRPFLNAIAQIKCDNTKPEQLLGALKNIEKKIGRKAHLKWAPRVIDLDILLFGEQTVNTENLKIPHPELTKRNFVLSPLKEISPSLKIPGTGGKTVLELSRLLPVKIPAWMFIVNITPDSFSDGGQITGYAKKPPGGLGTQHNFNKFEAVLQKACNIQIVDLGAESTRPGAVPVPAQEEWNRLKPYVEFFFEFYKDKIFRPRLSVDTRHIFTAEKALEMGADIINDVGGLSEEMLKLLSQSKAEYVLTHSLTVPADPAKTLPDKAPVEEIKKWLEKKICILKEQEINLNRIIFDPGIGFGKTAGQSLEILKKIEEFYCFPLRIMTGHSRKSFMKGFSPAKPADRDPESAGVSVFLASKGVDILRVHSADFHARVLRGFHCLN